MLKYFRMPQLICECMTHRRFRTVYTSRQIANLSIRRDETYNLTFNMLPNIMSPPIKIKIEMEVDGDLPHASAHTASHAFPVSACCTLYAVNER